MAQVCIARGDRGGTVLVCDSYRYQLHKRNTDSMRWRCWRKECRVPLTTNLFNIDENNPRIIVMQRQEHGHREEDEMIKRAEFRETMKQTISQNPTIPSRRVYNDAVSTEHRHARQGGGDRPTLPRFNSVRSQLERHKRDLQPQVPGTVDDVVLEGPWAQTWMGDAFVVHHGHQGPCDWGCAIFSTDENLQILRKCSSVYMDGTFKSCPRPYSQVFTIMGRYKGRTLPLVNCLMEARTIGHYRHVLEVVKQQVRRVSGRGWRPNEVVCDFEQGLISAIETELPTALVLGCYFHFTQSLWRQIQDLGLSGAFRRDRDLEKCIRKVMALGYLPLPLVRNNFRTYSRNRRVRGLMHRYPDLEAWFDYVQDTYIDGQFQPARWNVYRRNMDTRTNNNLESYHRTLNDAIAVRHPSLWTFIRHLKDQQAKTETTIDEARRGEPRPPRKRKWRVIERRLLSLKGQYEDGTRSLAEYWNAVRHYLGDF